MDINDESHAAVYHTERIAKFKENGLSENDYWDKYRDLDYLFYNKDFFYDFAIQNNLKIKISPQTNVHYGNSKLRFNVIFNRDWKTLLKGYASDFHYVKNQKCLAKYAFWIKDCNFWMVNGRMFPFISAHQWIKNIFKSINRHIIKREIKIVLCVIQNYN